MGAWGDRRPEAPTEDSSRGRPFPLHTSHIRLLLWEVWPKSLMPAGDPLLEVGGLVADGRGVAVAGVDDGLGRQRQQLGADRVDARGEVGERPARRPGAGLE